MKVVGKVWFDYTGTKMEIHRRVEVHAEGRERDISKIALRMYADDKGLEFDYLLGGEVFVEHSVELQSLDIADDLFKEFTRAVQQEMDGVVQYINEVKRVLSMAFKQEREI